MSPLTAKQRRQLDDAHATAVSALRQVNNAVSAVRVAFGRDIGPEVGHLLEDVVEAAEALVDLVEAKQEAEEQ